MGRPLKLARAIDQPVRRKVRLEDDIAAALAEVAAKERRTLLGQVNHVLRRWLDEQRADGAAA